jgi:hypothetical protein
MLQQLLTFKSMSRQRTSQNTRMNNFIVRHIWNDTKNPRCDKLIWIPQSDIMWHEQLKMLEVGVMSLVDKKTKINPRWSRYYEVHRSAKADLKCQCWYEVPSLKSQVRLEKPMSIWSVKIDFKCQCWYEVPSSVGKVDVDFKCQSWFEVLMLIQSPKFDWKGWCGFQVPRLIEVSILIWLPKFNWKDRCWFQMPRLIEMWMLMKRFPMDWNLQKEIIFIEIDLNANWNESM